MLLYTLTKTQFCVILDPLCPKTGKNKMGAKIIRKGECSFFLHPGESLEFGRIQNIYILGEKDALLIRAMENYT